MYRNTYVKINENYLRNNIREIKKKYSDYEYYIGVVKANAYGHGFYSVKALKEGGVNYFATSSLEEALKVRVYDKTTPILCLEPIDKKNIDVILKNHITVTIDSVSTGRDYANLSLNSKLKVHIKLDTGMNRLGVKTQNELRTLVQLLETNSNIEIEGIYTHMATTGVYDPYYDKQIEKWNLLLDCIDLSRIKIVHLGRSLTLVNHAKLPFVNGIRLGIIMYGFNGSMKVQGGIVGFLKEKKRNHYLKKNHISESIRTNDLKLSTAFGLYTEVMAVKSVKKGEVIGYGAGYLALEDMKIAILPIGYADGMDKSFGFVMIGKNKCPIIGDICMDMTIVKVPSSVHLHDRVEIFGDTISVKAASSLRGVNAYHLFTSITSRVARVYNDLTEIEY